MNARTPLLAAALAAGAVPVGRAAAQAAGQTAASAVASPLAESPAAARGVAGQVVEAESGLPIEGATVVLLPGGAGGAVAVGALAADPGSNAFVAASRSAVTDAGGRYQFDGVPPGAYVLRVLRLGFRPATVSIELRGDATAGARVSVGMTVVPVRLRPVAVTGAAPEPFARHARSAPAAGDARLAALRQRQSRFLSTDVREVTQADVAEGVTLGETDLFRALQRLPGVSTRNDLTAELWTRGARWDQTRVTWDGLPLYNPLHVMGLLSAVNSDAVGAAVLHPGVRPASVGEGSAAVLDLRSRPGGGTGALRGVGEVSLLSMRATVDQTVANGRGAWMLSTRRSYADWAIPAMARGGLFGEGNHDVRFPYHFAELAGRGDWHFGGGRVLEVSVLRSRDHITGSITDFIGGSKAVWGNSVARATFAAPARLGPLGAVALRHTVGVSDYVGRTRRGPAPAPFPEYPGDDDVGLTPVQGAVRYASLAGEVAPVPAGEGEPPRARWAAGWELSRQQARAEGALRLGYTLAQDDSTPGRLAGAVTQLAVWGERRTQPTPRLTLGLGLRAEGGTPVPGAGPLGALRLAPRLSARYAVGDSQTFVSAAAGRSFQYVQTSPRSDVAGDLDHEILTPIPLWGVAGARGEGSAGGTARVPALRTDLLTLGAERWLGAGWLATANAYHRRTAGVLRDDPTPGVASAADPLFVVGADRASGVELGVRRLVGRVTVAGNYALARAETRAAGLRFASPQDQRHVMNGTLMWRAGLGLRLGAAYTGFSGAPYTRGQAGSLRTFYGSDTAYPWSSSTDRVDPATGRVLPDSVAFMPGYREAPGASRFPRFSRMDALVDWSGRIRRVRAGAYLQVHNVLLRQGNPLYLSGTYCGYSPFGGAPMNCQDQVQTSFPILPTLGVRLSF